MKTVIGPWAGKTWRRGRSRHIDDVNGSPIPTIGGHGLGVCGGLHEKNDLS